MSAFAAVKRKYASPITKSASPSFNPTIKKLKRNGNGNGNGNEKSGSVTSSSSTEGFDALAMLAGLSTSNFKVAPEPPRTKEQEEN